MESELLKRGNYLLKRASENPTPNHYFAGQALYYFTMANSREGAKQAIAVLKRNLGRTGDFPQLKGKLEKNAQAVELAELPKKLMRYYDLYAIHFDKIAEASRKLVMFPVESEKLQELERLEGSRPKLNQPAFEILMRQIEDQQARKQGWDTKATSSALAKRAETNADADAVATATKLLMGERLASAQQIAMELQANGLHFDDAKLVGDAFMSLIGDGRALVQNSAARLHASHLYRTLRGVKGG